MKKILPSTLLAAGMIFAATELASATMVQAPGNVRFNIKVKSLSTLKFDHVVKQAEDLSCGAAALATLFKYYYGEDKIEEKQIIDGIMAFGDKDKIKKDGFSLLELKKFGERRGYVSKGFKIPKVENLAKVKVPVLSLINTRGYNHFVVIKGVRNGRVLIADPAFGNISRPLSEFASGWSNVILVFLSATNGGESDFVQERTLRGPKSEIITLLDRNLYTIRPQSNEF